METVIAVQNGDVLAALRGFLRSLLEAKVVEGVYTLLEEDGVVMPALVTRPELLDQANPIAPVMNINAARAVSVLTGKAAPAKLAAVLRPCEIRALVELAKLQQASLDDLVIIGLDCPGTFEAAAFFKQVRGHINGAREYLDAAASGVDPTLGDLSLRSACQTCTQPLASGAHIQLHLFEADPDRGIPITIQDDLASALGLQEAPDFQRRGPAAAEDNLARRTKARQAEEADLQQRLHQDGGLASLFAACQRCYNCSTACPMCYCKACLFRTASFDHQPVEYLNTARRKGAVRMLSDTMLFHLTRLNHMSHSCVGCGMCTSACPAEIPVGSIFRYIGGEVQKVFEYVPGRDAGETIPLITFQPGEWAEIGEER